jgi:hypothetical protein
MLYLTLLTITVVMGANCFAAVLCNRKMLGMPELSSTTSVRANISYLRLTCAGERDREVVMLVQPSPVPVELRRVSLRLTI